MSRVRSKPSSPIPRSAPSKALPHCGAFPFWDIANVGDVPAHAFPYFARGKGKDALLAAWKASRCDYEFLSYAPFLVVAESADNVVVVVKMRIKVLATDRFGLVEASNLNPLYPRVYPPQRLVIGSVKPTY